MIIDFFSCIAAVNSLLQSWGLAAVEWKCPNFDESRDELSGVAAVCSSRKVVAELLHPPNGMLVGVGGAG